MIQEYSLDKAKAWLTGVSGTALSMKYSKELAKLLEEFYERGYYDAQQNIRIALGIND